MFGTATATWFIITTPLPEFCAHATCTASPVTSPTTNSIDPRIRSPLLARATIQESGIRIQHWASNQVDNGCNIYGYARYRVVQDARPRAEKGVGRADHPLDPRA